LEIDESTTKAPWLLNESKGILKFANDVPAAAGAISQATPTFHAFVRLRGATALAGQ
jgi:hypothetical protein